MDDQKANAPGHAYPGTQKPDQDASQRSSLSRGGSLGNASSASGNQGFSSAAAGSSMGGDVIGREPGNAIEQRAAELHRSIDRAAAAAQPAVDRLASSAHAGVDKLQTALADMPERLEDRTRQLKDAATRFSHSSREYIRNSPATSVAGALALGFVLARLLGRRRS